MKLLSKFQRVNLLAPQNSAQPDLETLSISLETTRGVFRMIDIQREKNILNQDREGERETRRE